MKKFNIKCPHLSCEGSVGPEVLIELSMRTKFAANDLKVAAFTSPRVVEWRIHCSRPGSPTFKSFIGYSVCQCCEAVTQ